VGFALIGLFSAALANAGSQPAHAAGIGMTVPPGGTFAPDPTTGTYTYHYSAITVAHEPGDETTETPTCSANNGATSGDGFISGGTFNEGTTTVTCMTTEDAESPAETPDSGSFTVKVADFSVFNQTVGTPPGCNPADTVPGTCANALLPASQTKTAYGKDAMGNETATFTVPQITAHDPGEPTEQVGVSCTPYAGTTTQELPQQAPPAINTITLPVRQASYKWQCTAKDVIAGELFAVNIGFVDLTVQDEPTVLSNPGNQPSGNQTLTADASDTKFVSYPTVTPSETPSGERDSSAATCSSDNFANPTTSGGTFPVGVTTVTCTAGDLPYPFGFGDGTMIPGRTATPIKFTVTVADQAVTLTVPSTQLAKATSSSGATVTYGPVAAVEDPSGEAESISPSCLATNNGSSSTDIDPFTSSGNFPVGGTTVTCTATDADALGTSASPTASFTVIVTNTPCTTLAGCNLHGLDLSGAYLPGTNSSGADLSNANLNEANLAGAYLANANLSGANLNRADLTVAILTGANLTGANLNRATLDGVAWSNTTCPDGTNSDNNGGTCIGHL
jgi:hypothetical protein